MTDDMKQCDPCPWPLDCCTEDGAPKPERVAADCPRAHDIWERRLGDARLVLVASPAALAPVAEEEELVGV